MPKSSNSENAWHVRIGGKEHGPFSSDKIRNLVKQGKIDENTEIRRASKASWRRAGQMRGLLHDSKAISNERTSKNNETEEIPDYLIVYGISSFIAFLGVVFLFILSYMFIWDVGPVSANQKASVIVLGKMTCGFLVVLSIAQYLVWGKFYKLEKKDEPIKRRRGRFKKDDENDKAFFLSSVSAAVIIIVALIMLCLNWYSIHLQKIKPFVEMISISKRIKNMKDESDGGLYRRDKFVVWDLNDEEWWRVDSSIRPSSTDDPITVLMVHTSSVKVGEYVKKGSDGSSGGVEARQYTYEVHAVDWPTRTYLGKLVIEGDPPPETIIMGDTSYPDYGEVEPWRTIISWPERK